MKIEGIEQFESNIKKLLNVTDFKEMKPVYLEAAELVRDRIKDNAPQGPTGNLKRSPVAKALDNVVIAGIDRKIAPHAHLLEFGTVKMAARPFFRPAIDTSKNDVAEIIKNGARENIEGAL